LPKRIRIVLHGRRWSRGLIWSDLSLDLVLIKETTKTGAIVAHDLKLCPIVMDVLHNIPAERRVGPLIIDEEAGRRMRSMHMPGNGA
jgi:hypothetical protein